MKVVLCFCLNACGDLAALERPQEICWKTMTNNVDNGT